MGHLVHREAAEQPERVAALLDRRGQIASVVEPLTSRFDDVLLVARGSSDNAARYAQYVLGIRNGLRASLATPSIVTRYGRCPDLHRTLVVGISQSGASPDIVEVLAEAGRQGAPTLAITNDASSALAAVAEVVIDLAAGPEHAVAATKTYTSSLAAAALLSVALGAPADGLDLVPDAMAQVLVAPLPTAGIQDWVTAGRGIVVGRGLEFASAHETALKLQELGGVIAQAHSSADVRHGPVGGLTGPVPVILFGVHGQLASDAAVTAAELAGRAPLLTIGTLDEVHAHAAPGASWPVPRVDEWLMPMVTVVAGQRLAIALAEAKGLDVDQPEGLTKVTHTF